MLFWKLTVAAKRTRLEVLCACLLARLLACDRKCRLSTNYHHHLFSCCTQSRHILDWVFEYPGHLCKWAIQGKRMRTRTLNVYLRHIFIVSIYIYTYMHIHHIYIYIFTYIYLNISLSLSIYICIYIYIHMYIPVYIHIIYIYIYRAHECVSLRTSRPPLL